MNDEKYLEIIRQADPELYLIKMALLETKVNPLILIPIIRTLGNLMIGTGFGQIRIFLVNHVITQLKAEESVEVNANLLTQE